MEQEKKDFETTENSSKSTNEENSSSIKDNTSISHNTEYTHIFDNICDFMNNRKNEWYPTTEILEEVFIKLYMNFRELKYINQKFYSLNGNMSENKLKQEIQEILENARYNKPLATKVNSLFSALKNKCLSDYSIEDNVVFTENQKLQITKENGIEILSNETTTNRLNAKYIKDYAKPKKWLQFLNDLFNEIDIFLLQQFFGYCLLANISAQKMLIIIGQTGIGKSRIGVVLKAIFGESMLSRGINELFNDTNRFAFANAANKLIYFDDDISNNYILNDTRRLRILITGGDEKGEEKHEKELTFTPYGKVIALGNYNFKFCKKDIEAMKRRSIILKTKDKDPNRIDNTLIDKELLAEKDLIFNWMLEGAVEIVKNECHFTHEEYRNKILNEYFFESKSEEGIEDKNSYIHDFLTDKNYIIIDGISKTFTFELYSKYQQWCIDNNKECHNNNKFAKDLAKAGDIHNIIVGKDIRKNGAKHKGSIGVRTVD